MSSLILKLSILSKAIEYNFDSGYNMKPGKICIT